MRFSSLGLLAGLTVSVVAEDLLFIDSLQDKEYGEAIALSYTAKVVIETEWRVMATADFAASKAIVISDPDCGDISQIKFFLGNMILIGIPPCK